MSDPPTRITPDELEHLNELLFQAKMQLAEVRPVLDEHWDLGFALEEHGASKRDMRRWERSLTEITSAYGHWAYRKETLLEQLREAGCQPIVGGQWPYVMPEVEEATA
jgi:hypothetical protein